MYSAPLSTALLHPTPTKIQNPGIQPKKENPGPQPSPSGFRCRDGPSLQLGQDGELKAGVEGRGSGESVRRWLYGSSETAEVGGGA